MPDLVQHTEPCWVITTTVSPAGSTVRVQVHSQSGQAVCKEDQPPQERDLVVCAATEFARQLLLRLFYDVELDWAAAGRETAALMASCFSARGSTQTATEQG